MSDPKDGWDKLDILAKGFLAVGAPIAIAWYANSMETARAEEAEANRAAQVLIQALASREAVSSTLRAQMFSTLMEHYFKEDKDPSSRILILELVALNFNEQFRLRPLFEQLNSELSEPSHKEELRKVARNVASREISRILGSGGGTCEFDLALEKRVQAECAPVSLKLLEVNEDKIRVSTRSDDDEGFDINFFDTPFTDNTRLGELTYSLMLVDVNPTGMTATVELVYFPQHYYSDDNRLKLDEMMGKYLDKKYLEKQK